jgi:hypothetical protein
MAAAKIDGKHRLAPEPAKLGGQPIILALLVDIDALLDRAEG